MPNNSFNQLYTSIRATIRRIRLYWKSWRLLKDRLDSWGLALCYPFFPRGRKVIVKFSSRRQIEMAAENYVVLPALCKLDRINADFEILPTEKKVYVDGLTLYSPLWAGDEASYYSEVLLDDGYHIKGLDLEGKIVVDVGAYVGDSALAFARQGAIVHAVEPLDEFCYFIKKNFSANHLSHRLHLHPVGLSDHPEDITNKTYTLHLVEGVAYTLRNLPRQIDILKLDCEGAEYHLLADPRFLDHLQPQEICMEFHAGVGPIQKALEIAGYDSRLASDPSSKLGTLFATRRKRIVQNLNLP